MARIYLHRFSSNDQKTILDLDERSAASMNRHLVNDLTNDLEARSNLWLCNISSILFSPDIHKELEWKFIIRIPDFMRIMHPSIRALILIH